MPAYLVPSSGGKAIALTRDRAYLGRRKDADGNAPLSAETALCRLQLIDGWWHASDLAFPSGLRINGVECRKARLEPNDEIVLGRARFRIKYQSPNDDRVALEAVAESVLFDAPKAKADPTVKQSELPGSASPPVAAATIVASSGNELLGRLIPLGGGLDYPLMKPRLTIGRKSNCDIVIRSSTVSSLHCGLELLDGYWRMVDLGSRNGIRVNGIRCQKGWLLPNSRLSIADLRFQIEYQAQGPPPEADLSDPSYRVPLMQKIGATPAAWDQAVARLDTRDADDDKRVRYNPQEDI